MKNKIKNISMYGIMALAVVCLLPSCEDVNTGYSGSNDSIIVTSVTPAMASNYPADGHFTVNLDYHISDESYKSANNYQIYGYFRLSSGLMQVFNEGLNSANQDGSIVADFTQSFSDLPTDTQIPYRLYFQLMDETGGINTVLSHTDDLVYNPRYVGTWYDVRSKSVISSDSIEVWKWKNGGYIHDYKGTGESTGANTLRYELTHRWNEDTGQWEQPSPPESGEVLWEISTNGNLILYKDTTNTSIDKYLYSQESTHNQVYAEKWWTDEYKVDPSSDNGMELKMSDNYFSSRRDNQIDYPYIELGTVSATGNTLTLTVTHYRNAAGNMVFSTASPPTTYTMTYGDYDPNGAGGHKWITLTESSSGSGGIYADDDGVRYKDTH